MKTAIACFFVLGSLGCTHGSVRAAYPSRRPIAVAGIDRPTRDDAMTMQADGVCLDATTRGASVARTYVDDDGEVRLASTSEARLQVTERGERVCFASSARVRASYRPTEAAPIALDGPGAWQAPPMLAQSNVMLIP